MVLYQLEKATTGTKYFVSKIDISMVLLYQHLLWHRCLSVCQYIFSLILNKILLLSLEGKSITLSSLSKAGSWYCHKLPDICYQIMLSIYAIKLCIGITVWMSSALSNCVLFISIMQSVSGTQILSVTFHFF